MTTLRQSKRWDDVIELGGTFQRVLTFTDDADAAINLTGYIFALSLYDDDGEIVTTVSSAGGHFVLTDPAAGEVTLTLTDEQTAALDGAGVKDGDVWAYDLVSESPAGAREVVAWGAWTVYRVRTVWP